MHTLLVGSSSLPWTRWRRRNEAPRPGQLLQEQMPSAICGTLHHPCRPGTSLNPQRWLATRGGTCLQQTRRLRAPGPARSGP